MTDDQFDDAGPADADVDFGDLTDPADAEGADSDSDSDAEATDVGASTDGGQGWSSPEPTGVAQVDSAIAELARLDQLPTSEHVAVFDAVHRTLQDSLADLDGS